MALKTLLTFTAIGGTALATASHAADCNNLPEWNAGTAYTGGAQVQTGGSAYEANWWTQGQDPATHSGSWREWELLGPCGGASSSSLSSSSSSSSNSSSEMSSSSSVVSSSSSSVSSTGGSCSAPQYAAGTAYTQGQIVRNAGHEYRCQVAGWCSSNAAWAYAPGTGAHWRDAWSLEGGCGAASSSSTSSSSNSTSSSSSSSSSSASVSSSSSLSSSSSSVPDGDFVLQNNFNHHPEGLYSAAMFAGDWGTNPPVSAGVVDGRLSVTADPAASGSSNRVLRVKYNQRQVGGSSAAVFRVDLPQGPHQSLWLQYKVMFSSNFDWVKGGKLPGLAGYTGQKPTGCLSNSSINGFSARFMWRENGHAFQYLYNPSKSEYCGDYSSFYEFFTAGRWHTITSHVQLDDAGQNNGRINAYLDGELTLSLSDLDLRNDSSVSINKLLFETFFGGSGSEWAPSQDQYAYFDDIVVSESSTLSYVSTEPVKNIIEGPHPIPGYNPWDSGAGYDEGSLVYQQDAEGNYRYFRARYGIAPNKAPLSNSLPENYVGIYNPVRLDNSEPWVELSNP